MPHKTLNQRTHKSMRGRGPISMIIMIANDSNHVMGEKAAYKGKLENKKEMKRMKAKVIKDPRVHANVQRRWQNFNVARKLT